MHASTFCTESVRVLAENVWMVSMSVLSSIMVTCGGAGKASVVVAGRRDVGASSLSVIRDPRTRRSYIHGSTYSVTDSVTNYLLLHSRPVDNKVHLQARSGVEAV